ncbi:hypothetical protein LPB41_04435 [Thalassospira sp. MA62]|nr:hypothetical protein [Thalassospira sp. MA62]
MTAQQAAASQGFERGHKKRRARGCGPHQNSRDGDPFRHRGFIGRTVTGIAQSFGIPRKGVLVSWILILIFSFPVGVMLFALAWVYVHHPGWFDNLRGTVRGAKKRATPAGQRTHTSRPSANSQDSGPQDRPTMGVDFEESWMEELREKFDDLERRTGSMEGFVASGEYRVASELEKMKKDSDGASDRGATDHPAPPKA